MTQNQRRLFGTDGVRGVANTPPMTVGTALKIGQAAALLIKRDFPASPKIVIGKDTRISGCMLENALAAGIASMGVDVVLCGVLPTPGVAFMTTALGASAGAVISASHNPFEDNGIKFFGHNGYKLPDAVELAIEAHVFDENLALLLPPAAQIGQIVIHRDAQREYIGFLKSALAPAASLAGLRIVLDCANGAASQVAPQVLSELGAEVIPIACQPDGVNINEGCGSLHPEAAAARVLETGADLGLTLDGDADRLILIDNQGRTVNGDHIMAICAQALARQGRLAQRTVVATVMSNLGLERFLGREDIRLLRTQVGDRYVVEEMLKSGYNFGGEQSGHLIFLDMNTTGDGLLAALQVLGVVLESGQSLAELAGQMEVFPQVLLNVRVSRRVDLAAIPEIKKQFDHTQARLGATGRLLVRYSGTEPKVRVMVEGQDMNLIQTLASQTAASIERALS